MTAGPWIAAALLLAFAGQALAHEEKLEGSEWGMVGDPETGARFISFAGQGRFFAFGGCNRIGGAYEQHDAHLVITPETVTEMGCAAEVMKREAEFIALLGKVRGAKADHTLLLLLDENSTDLRTLIRRSPEAAGTEE